MALYETLFVVHPEKGTRIKSSLTSSRKSSKDRKALYLKSMNGLA
jgi:hypothetical protein